METENQTAAGGHENAGHHEFSITYDDTGASVVVDAPNGWRMQQVVDAAYTELEEVRQTDDRIEFGTTVLTPELLAMHVKEFLEHGYAIDGKLHIVSKPGGAFRAPDSW